MMWHKVFPMCECIEGYTDGFVTTSQVMSFEPDKFGLYDMGGDVEWVEDWGHKAEPSSFMWTAKVG